MVKMVLLGIGMVSMLSGSESDEAVCMGNWDVLTRMAYVSQNNDAANSTYATAAGLKLKYETAPFMGFTAGAAGYLTGVFPFASGSGEERNMDMLSFAGNSDAYIGEMYLQYSNDVWTIRLGRQLFDSPFADTDEVRMHPNTFEGLSSTYALDDQTMIYGGFFRKWAGYDSGGRINEFKRFSEHGEGVYFAGFTNESIDGIVLQGWLYRVDGLADIGYADASFTSESAGLDKQELSIQYTHLNENATSKIAGNVYGARAVIEFWDMSAEASYNRSFNPEGKTVINGFGGGPYYSSMEETTIDGMEDAKAFRVSIGADLEKAGMKGVAFTAAHGVFKSNRGDTKLQEFDMIATYQSGPKFSTDISYARIVDKHRKVSFADDQGYSRFLARINYNF